MGRCKHRESQASRQWKGVRKRAWGRWVAEIREPSSGELLWLGTYATAEEAAHAYDDASLYLQGPSASLNFPCSTISPLLISGSSLRRPLSKAAIQSIAATATAWEPEVKFLGFWNHGSLFEIADRGNRALIIDVGGDGKLRFLGMKEHFKERYSQIRQQISANHGDNHIVSSDEFEIAHRGNQAHIIDVEGDSILRSLRDGMRFLGTKEHFKERFSQILQRYSANGENGINLAGSDEQGRNLLHWAAMLGNNSALEAMAEVLERRNLIDLLNARDSTGKTPLILAVQAGHSSTVALLCRTGPSQFVEEIEPNIEDCTGKSALDHAKNEKKGDIVREMLKRADVQYDEAQRRDEIKWIATRLAVVGTADFGLLALMSNQFSGPSNGQGAVGTLTVSVACALSSCVAVLMFVCVPGHEKAGRLYLSQVFTIAFPTCLLSLFSFLFGLLISPKLSLPNMPALQLGLPCLAAVVTFFICACSRAYAIDKYGAQRFFPRKGL